MALTERTPPVNLRTGKCSIGVLLETLEGAELDWLDDKLDADPRFVTHAWIAEQLTDEFGRRYGQDTVGRHRNGKCACEPR